MIGRFGVTHHTGLTAEFRNNTKVLIIHVLHSNTFPFQSLHFVEHFEGSYSEHLFKCFSDVDGRCTFEEVNFQTDLKKTIRQGYFHRNPYCISQQTTRELSRVNKTTWAATCIYLHQVSPHFTSQMVLVAISQGTAGLWFMAYMNLKDNLNISVICWEPKHNLPLFFGRTGLCLYVTGHKTRTQADSQHPAHVISIDSSPNMCLCTLTESPLAQGHNLLFHY